MAKIRYSEKEWKKMQKARAKSMLKSSPKWLQMMVKEMNLEPESVVVSINTPVMSEHVSGYPTAMSMTHTGQVNVSVEGYRKVK